MGGGGGVRFVESLVTHFNPNSYKVDMTDLLGKAVKRTA